MHVNGTTHIHGAQPINAPHRIQATESHPMPDRINFNDEVHISPEAELISQVREMPEIRADMVARLKAEIETGVYENKHRLEVAVDRLLDEMAG
jgi:negative regulator of flagellin synthesis FlgM